MEHTTKLLALRKNHKYEYQMFPFHEGGARAAVGFLEESGGAIYRIEYYKHKDEILPRSTKVGEICTNT